jgi:hypothetical protein
MVYLFDVIRVIENELPIFTYGENYIDGMLNKFPFTQEGIRARWEWFKKLDSSVSQVMIARFPEIEERIRYSIADYQMSQLRERIKRTEREYAYCCSL